MHVLSQIIEISLFFCHNFKVSKNVLPVSCGTVQWLSGRWRCRWFLSCHDICIMCLYISTSEAGRTVCVTSTSNDSCFEVICCNMYVVANSFNWMFCKHSIKFLCTVSLNHYLFKTVPGRLSSYVYYWCSRHGCVADSCKIMNFFFVHDIFCWWTIKDENSNKYKKNAQLVFVYWDFNMSPFLWYTWTSLHGGEKKKTPSNHLSKVRPRCIFWTPSTDTPSVGR